MDKLLHFIDHLCLDDQLYWRVPLLAGSAEADIRWQRTQKPYRWTVRTEDGGFAKDVASADLLAALAAGGVDSDNLAHQMSASILTQAVFAHMVTDAAVALFGADVVARSVADTREFLQSVSDTALQLSPAPPVAHLRLLRD